MIELNDFYNAGFGWICRHCEREFSRSAINSSALPRIFREGESESKSPTLESKALAKWADAAQTILTCPRCGLTEPVEKL